MTPPKRDKPWLIRTYAGHSTAAKSNELYRRNLGKGQTGLSVAFDLPTQTGYDADDELARGEVGKVGVPISHQNDIIKEYLSRGTYAFPPGPSLRLIADMVAYTVEHVPKWNPVNVCSYHLQ